MELGLTHTYIPLDEYPRKWIFNHHQLPVDEQDKAWIKPLSQKSAMQVWQQLISTKSVSPEFFHKEDWPMKPKTFKATDEWQSVWDSDDNSLPSMLAEFIEWPDDTLVYFCYEKYQVIETRWDVFARHWKNFLFFDDSPLLVSPSSKQAVMFEQNGNYKMGSRS